MSVNAEPGDFKILQVNLDSSANLLVLSGNSTCENVEFSTGRLSNPDRSFIDIKNAVLIGTKKSFTIKNSEISEIKLAQFSTTPNTVRLVITAASPEALNKIKTIKYQDSIAIKLDSLKTGLSNKAIIYTDDNNEVRSLNLREPKKEITASHVTDERSKRLSKLLETSKFVISDIRVNRGHLVVSGAGTALVKKPFILDNPKRIVFDLPETITEYKNIVQEFDLPDGDRVKTGQFNPTTFRIVINTEKPEQYKSLISPDSQSIIFAPDNRINLSELPDGDSPGRVESIKVVKKDPKTTVITIKATYPIICNIDRAYNKAILNLYNVHAPEKVAVMRLEKTPQFKGIDIETLPKAPNGSKWIFPLNTGAKIDSSFSYDGKTLEITINDSNVQPASEVASGPVIRETPKAISARKLVVLDAGHGGSDCGATRAGVYEKDITLDVTKKIRDYLARAGVQVIMTRETDQTISLRDRVEIANRADPDAFISIHVNAAESTSARGIETYWYNENSIDLAKTVQGSFAAAVNSPNRGIIKSMFYVIHHTRKPSVLVEIGFISNDQERAELISPAKQEIIAHSIAQGILSYLNLESKR